MQIGWALFVRSKPRQPSLRSATTESRNGVSNDFRLCNSPQTHEQPLHLLLNNRFQRWIVRPYPYRTCAGWSPQSTSIPSSSSSVARKVTRISSKYNNSNNLLLLQNIIPFGFQSFVGLWVDPLRRNETNNKLKLALVTSPTARYDGSGAVLKVRFRNRRDKPTLRN